MDNIINIIGYVDRDEITEEQAMERAKALVAGKDGGLTQVENDIEAEFVTKLYYIVPTIGKIIVAVSDEDKNIIGASDNILANTDIASYPFSKLPSKIVEYRELIIKPQSSFTLDDAKNIAQAMANDVFAKTTKKVPVVKIIDYKGGAESTLVLPSLFDGKAFLNSDAPLVTDGDPEAGNVMIEELGFDMPAGLGRIPDLKKYLKKFRLNNFPEEFNGDPNFSKNWSHAAMLYNRLVDKETWLEMREKMKVGIVMAAPDAGFLFLTKEQLFEPGICKQLAMDLEDSILWENNKGTCGERNGEVSLIGKRRNRNDIETFNSNPDAKFALVRGRAGNRHCDRWGDKLTFLFVK